MLAACIFAVQVHYEWLAAKEAHHIVLTLLKVLAHEILSDGLISQRIIASCVDI